MNESSTAKKLGQNNKNFTNRVLCTKPTLKNVLLQPNFIGRLFQCILRQQCRKCRTIGRVRRPARAKCLSRRDGWTRLAQIYFNYQKLYSRAVTGTVQFHFQGLIVQEVGCLSLFRMNMNMKDSISVGIQKFVVLSYHICMYVSRYLLLKHKKYYQYLNAIRGTPSSFTQ